MEMLKLTAIGSATGIVIPEDVLRRLGLAPGDALELRETEGGFALTRHDAAAADALARVEDIAGRYPETLRILAQ